MPMLNSVITVQDKFSPTVNKYNAEMNQSSRSTLSFTDKLGLATKGMSMSSGAALNAAMAYKNLGGSQAPVTGLGRQAEKMCGTMQFAADKVTIFRDLVDSLTDRFPFLKPFVYILDDIIDILGNGQGFIQLYMGKIEKIGRWTDKIVGFFIALKKFHDSTAGKIVEGVLKLAALAGVGVALYKIVKLLQNVFPKALGMAKKALFRLGVEGSWAFNPIRTKINDTKKSVKAMADLYGGYFKQKMDILKFRGEIMWEMMKWKASDATKKIKGKFDELHTKALWAWSGIKTKIKEQDRYLREQFPLYDKLRGKIDIFAGKVAKKYGELANKVKGKFDEISKVVKKKMFDVGAKASWALWPLKKKAKEVFDDMRMQWLYTQGSMMDKWIAAKSAFIKGFDGLKKGASRTFKRIKKLAFDFGSQFTWMWTSVKLFFNKIKGGLTSFAANWAAKWTAIKLFTLNAIAKMKLGWQAFKATLFGKKMVAMAIIFWSTVKALAKSVFGFIRSNIKNIISIVKNFFAAKSFILGFVGMVKTANQFVDKLQALKDKVDEFAEKFEGAQAAARRAFFFGEEGAKAMTGYAKAMAEQWGRSAGEILNASTNLRKLGVGGGNITKIMDISNKLADFLPEQGFEGISSAIQDAIKSGSAEGLAQFFGGGAGVERQIKRLRIGRDFAHGNIDRGLEKLQKLMDKYGMTNEAAAKLANTPQKKLQQISSTLENMISKYKKIWINIMGPYIDQIHALVTSDEFKANFEIFARQIGAIAKAVAFLTTKIFEFGVKLYQWWLDPSSEVIRNIKLFLAVKGAIAGCMAVVATAKVGLKGLGVAFKFLGFDIGGVIKGLIEYRKKLKAAAATSAAVSGFGKLKLLLMNIGKLAGKATKMLIGMLLKPPILIPVLVIAFTKLAQKIFENVTGVKLTFEEAFSMLVTGCYVTIQKIKRFFLEAANWWMGQFEKDLGNIQSFVESVVNLFLWLKDKIVGIWESVTNGVASGIQEVNNWLADSFIGKKMGFEKTDFTFKSELKKTERFKFDDKWFKPERFKIETDEEIIDKADKFNSDFSKSVNKFASWGRDLFGAQLMPALKEGFNTADKWLSELLGIKDDTGKIKQSMTHEQDLRWMKEMAEQRFVNRVNVRQLTPTVNVQVKSQASAQDIGAAVKRTLEEESARSAGVYYGNAG
jgi:hypothetical protein